MNLKLNLRIVCIAALTLFTACTHMESSPPDSEKIRQNVRENKKDVGQCFDEALKKDSALKGKVVLNWDIDDKGDVIKAEINKDKTTLKNEQMHTCLIEKVKTWKFPPAPEKQTVSVSYPFVFKSSK